MAQTGGIVRLMDVKNVIQAAVLIVVLAIQGRAAGAELLQEYRGRNGASVMAGFIPDTSEIVMGEPLFVTFVISNQVGQAFQFSQVRTEIFSIVATNANGTAARDLRNHMLDGNGFEKRVVVEPGKSHQQHLFNDWVGFDEPGKYTVTCTAFGMFFQKTQEIGGPIITVFPLTVLPADPDRLGKVIAAWTLAVQTNGNVQEAAQALAGIRDARTIPSLGLLVAGDAGYVAVTALARYTNDNAAAEALTGALTNGNDWVAQSAGNVLGKWGRSDRAARVYLPELKSLDPKQRILAARAAGWTHSTVAFAPLCELSRETNALVRSAAVEAIGRLGTPGCYEFLTNAVGDPDYGFRISAVKGLVAAGQTVQPSWVTPMIMNGKENVRSYYEAIDLLRIHGGDLAAPGLARCLHFDDPSVRHAYNFRLILALEFSRNGPQHYYQWQHDPNRDGTEQELAANQKILNEVKEWLRDR